MVCSSKDESQLRLNAMLYVLEDSNLDREAFENQLVENVRLAEILADTVLMYQGLHSIREGMLGQDLVGAQAASSKSVARAGQSLAVFPSWVAVASLAASLLLVGFLGWKSFESLSNALRSRQPGALASVEALSSNANSASLQTLLQAWGELRTSHEEDALVQHVCFIDREIPGTASELLNDDDVPEWLVLATAAILEQGGVDLPLEPVETRTVIQ
jgi:hypothetical protein